MDDIIEYLDLTIPDLKYCKNHAVFNTAHKSVKEKYIEDTQTRKMEN